MGGGIKLRKIWSMPYLQIIIFLTNIFLHLDNFFLKICISSGRLRTPESPGWWCLGEAPGVWTVHLLVTGEPAKGRFGSRSRCSSTSPGRRCSGSSPRPGPPRGSAGTAGTAAGLRRYRPGAARVRRRPRKSPLLVNPRGSLGKGWGRAGGVDQLLPRSRPSAAGAKITHWGWYASALRKHQDFLPGTSIFVGCGF